MFRPSPGSSTSGEARLRATLSGGEQAGNAALERVVSAKRPKLYSIRDVSQAAKRAVRTIYADMREEGCPLRWTHRVRREVHTTKQVLEAYVRWVAERVVRPIESAS